MYQANSVYEVAYKYGLKGRGGYFTAMPIFIVSVADLASVTRLAERMIRSFHDEVTDIVVTSVVRHEHPAYIDPMTIIKKQE